MARKLGTLGRIGIGLAVSAAAGTASAVPPFLSEQGRLFDATSGDPVDEPLGLSVKFSIYADDTTTTPLWTETQTIAIEDGYFSAVLGDVSNSGTAITASVFNGATRYLGIKIGLEAEMTPRQPIVSVPYAIVAQRVLNKDGDVIIDDDGVWQGDPTGLVGPTGPAGADGAAGPTGPAGNNGSNGATGPTGPAGNNGNNGTNGATGPTGPAGNNGNNGATGPTGPSGTGGATGPTGAAGATGPSGVTFNSDSDYIQCSSYGCYQTQAYVAAANGTTTYSANGTASHAAVTGETALITMTGYCSVPSTGSTTTYNGQSGHYARAYIGTSVNGGGYSATYFHGTISGSNPAGLLPIAQYLRQPLTNGTTYKWSMGAYQNFGATYYCYGGIMVLIVK